MTDFFYLFSILLKVVEVENLSFSLFASYFSFQTLWARVLIVSYGGDEGEGGGGRGRVTDGCSRSPSDPHTHTHTSRRWRHGVGVWMHAFSGFAKIKSKSHNTHRRTVGASSSLRIHRDWNCRQFIPLQTTREREELRDEEKERAGRCRQRTRWDGRCQRIISLKTHEGWKDRKTIRQTKVRETIIRKKIKGGQVSDVLLSFSISGSDCVFI